MKTPKEIMSQKILEAIVEFNNETGACPVVIRIKNINEDYSEYTDSRTLEADIEYEII